MAVKKRGLGKGLSALISEEPIGDVLISQESEDYRESIENIDIKLIIPNKEQPRKEFDKDALEELSQSIKIHGIIQPIVVRKADDKYEIIAGERRWRASKKAGLEDIPCIIKDIDTEMSTKLALIENIQRENLNPIEEALAYRKLMEDYKLTQEEVAKVVGKSRSYIANTIRLLNLDQKLINYISEGQLTSGHGKALLSIKDKKEQIKAAENIINNNLNVRETESIAKKTNIKPLKKEILSNKDAYIIDLEESLMRALGTKVNLIPGAKKGKIEIEYYGDEDLERIIETLVN